MSGGARRFPVILGTAILVLAGLFYGGWLLVREMDLFALERVRIEGLKRVPERELRELLPVRKGENLFRLDLREIKARLESHPWVASVQVSRDLPRTVVIQVKEEDPVAVTVLSGKLYFLNSAGRAFAEAPREALFDYPVVTVEAEELLQEEADFLRLMAWVRDKDIYLPCYESFSQVYLGRERILLYTKEGLRIQFEPKPLAALKADYRKLDRIMTYLYRNGLYRKAAAIRLDYPEGRALLAYREGKTR